MSGLTFAALRGANVARLPQFKNSKGEPAHSVPDGSDWSASDWLEALVGELGEYANLHKKVRRGDFTWEEAKEKIGKELADVQIYLDLLAFRLGLDLGAEVQAKFNETSEKVGSTVRIQGDGWYHVSAGEKGEAR